MRMWFLSKLEWKGRHLRRGLKHCSDSTHFHTHTHRYTSTHTYTRQRSRRSNCENEKKNFQFRIVSFFSGSVNILPSTLLCGLFAFIASVRHRHQFTYISVIVTTPNSSFIIAKSQRIHKFFYQSFYLVRKKLTQK